jgi:hypothetical protein
VVRRTFSPARAWRPAFGARLARTLGRTARLLSQQVYLPDCQDKVCRRQTKKHPDAPAWHCYEHDAAHERNTAQTQKASAAAMPTTANAPGHERLFAACTISAISTLLCPPPVRPNHYVQPEPQRHASMARRQGSTIFCHQAMPSHRRGPVNSDVRPQKATALASKDESHGQ